MIVGQAARRYASAIFDLARSTNSIDAWLRDLNTIESTVIQRGIIETLDNPAIPSSQKQTIIAEGFHDLPLDRRNLLGLLATRYRAHLIPGIVQAYRQLIDESQGQAVAEVTTAVPLDEDEARLVASRIGKMTGKKIQIQTRIDPSIIGGIIVRIGDKLIDGSISSRLAALRAQLAR